MTHDQIASALEKQTKAIERLADMVRLLLWLVSAAILLLVANLAFANEDLVAIKQDRAKFPQTRWSQIYYASLYNASEEERLQLQRALDFVVASCSSQQVLERSLPIPITNTVLRMDTSQLKWKSLPKLLMEHYPYYLFKGTKVPGTVRADWLVNFLLDQRKSNAYLLLLYGEQAPTTSEELNQLFKIENTPLVQNWVEDASGVAVNKTRLIKSYPTLLRADLWRTYDFVQINPDTDPLQNFDRKLEGAFSEWIGPLIKVSITTGYQGHLQRYALTDNTGKVAPAAPIGVVVDHTPLGPELINPRSCIACHTEGLRPMSINSVRRYIEAQVGDARLAVIAPKESAERERIERQFLSDMSDRMKFHNEKYAKIVELITGKTPEEVSADVVQVITNYNKDVDIGKAALELRVTEEKFLEALAKTSDIPARLAQLPKVPMSRENWEVIYPIALKMVRGAR